MQRVVGISKIIFIRKDTELYITGIKGRGFTVWCIMRGELYKKGS
jgi:hypothetical protein